METNTFCGRCSHLGCSVERSGNATALCSKNCVCYLTRILDEIKTKILDHEKKLNEFSLSSEATKCIVKLTSSEEMLFESGLVKDDSMVCCVLVRELRKQKRDLEKMMASWLKFADKADRFSLLINDIRDKLTVLAPRVDSLIQETKYLEDIELKNEETREEESNERLGRSEKRREIYRETVHRYVDAATRDHLENSARREKLEFLDRERLMDRAALKLALERMMKMAKDLSELTSKLEKSGERCSLPPDKEVVGGLRRARKSGLRNNPETPISILLTSERKNDEISFEHVRGSAEKSVNHFGKRTLAQ